MNTVVTKPCFTYIFLLLDEFKSRIIALKFFSYVGKKLQIFNYSLIIIFNYKLCRGIFFCSWIKRKKILLRKESYSQAKRILPKIIYLLGQDKPSLSEHNGTEYFNGYCIQIAIY